MGLIITENKTHIPSHGISFSLTLKGLVVFFTTGEGGMANNVDLSLLSTNYHSHSISFQVKKHTIVSLMGLGTCVMNTCKCSF